MRWRRDANHLRQPDRRDHRHNQDAVDVRQPEWRPVPEPVRQRPPSGRHDDRRDTRAQCGDPARRLGRFRLSPQRQFDGLQARRRHRTDRRQAHRDHLGPGRGRQGGDRRRRSSARRREGQGGRQPAGNGRRARAGRDRAARDPRRGRPTATASIIRHRHDQSGAGEESAAPAAAANRRLRPPRPRKGQRQGEASSTATNAPASPTHRRGAIRRPRRSSAPSGARRRAGAGLGAMMLMGLRTGR